jgi:acyl carrier protein
MGCTYSHDAFFGFPCTGKRTRAGASGRDDFGKGLAVTTFDRVADIIADTIGMERDKITLDSHTIDDLGIDSLEFLDIVFAIDKEMGIKIPLERWTQEVNEGKVPADAYFVMRNLCAQIDSLVAAKAA